MADTDAIIQQALKAEEAERKLQKQQKHVTGGAATHRSGSRPGEPSDVTLPAAAPAR